MGRPRKNPEAIMDSDLRIPLTADQKKLIAEAASINPEGMAGWARDILINAAKKQLSNRSASQKDTR